MAASKKKLKILASYSYQVYRRAENCITLCGYSYAVENFIDYCLYLRLYSALFNKENKINGSVSDPTDYLLRH